MDTFPFPFPCKIELGLLVIEVGRNCVVLRRKDRKYPHVTCFYKKKEGRGYWWPHITMGPDRHEELLKIRPKDGEAFARRFESVVLPRTASVLRPVTLEELSANGWFVLVPSMRALVFFLNLVLVGDRTIVLEKLEELGEDEEAVELLWSTMVEDAIDPREVPNREIIGVPMLLRIVDDTIEQGVLYGWDLEPGRRDWFMAPKDLVNMEPTEFVETITPGAPAIMRRVAEVLDLPFVPNL